MSYTKDTLSGEVPPEAASYVEHVEKQLEKIEQAFRGQDVLYLTPRAVVPDKLTEGMVVLADGTNWNPGSGAGFYGYYGSAWVKLG